MLQIDNQYLKVLVHNKGAELQSIFGKESQLEYLWNGDPVFWEKRSPVLFPIVGTLKEDRYFFEGKSYRLSRHGFARDKEFRVEEVGGDHIRFLLQSDAASLKVFPFEFEFRIQYRINKETLEIGYEVKNKSASLMFFSLGAHPAFRLPLTEDTRYEDYYLVFNQTETLSRWPISRDGLIEKDPLPLLQDSNHLPLSRELFSKDALVMKHPVSTALSLKSSKTSHGWEVNFSGFPYLGLWAAPQADFICIEPWCGIADSVDADQQLTHKEGICKLLPGKVFERRWSVRFS